MSKSFFSARIRSPFFWCATAILLVFISYRTSSIDTQAYELRDRVANAKRTLSTGKYPPVNVCNDGWISYSDGAGTCSSHGGINYRYKNERNILVLTSTLDPEKIRNKKIERLNNISMLAMLVIFVISPFFDGILKQFLGTQEGKSPQKFSTPNRVAEPSRPSTRQGDGHKAPSDSKEKIFPAHPDNGPLSFSAAGKGFISCSHCGYAMKAVSNSQVTVTCKKCRKKTNGRVP